MTLHTERPSNDELGREDRKHLAIRIIDPEEIEELAKTSPVLAAHKCKEGVTSLEIGTQKIRRRHIAASYLIAYNIKHNEKELEWFAFNYQCAGFAQKQDTEKTRDRLIYQVFDFNFSKIEGTTPHRAYSYAYALEAYLKEDTDPEQVKALVMKRGPEKLYRETLERNKLAKALAKYRESGRDPSGPIDESYFLELEQDDEEEDGANVECNAEGSDNGNIVGVLDHKVEHDGPGRDELDDDHFLLANESDADEDDDDILYNDEWDADEEEEDGPSVRESLCEERRSELLQLVLQLEAGLNDLRNRIGSL